MELIDSRHRERDQGDDSHAVIKAVTSHFFLSYFQMAEASLNGTFGAFLISVIVSSWFIKPWMH